MVMDMFRSPITVEMTSGRSAGIASVDSSVARLLYLELPPGVEAGDLLRPA